MMPNTIGQKYGQTSQEFIYEFIKMKRTKLNLLTEHVPIQIFFAALIYDLLANWTEWTVLL